MFEQKQIGRYHDQRYYLMMKQNGNNNAEHTLLCQDKVSKTMQKRI